MVILGLNPRKVYERQNPNFAILMHSKGNRELLIRMLYISYGSVCELETQILLAGDLGFIEIGELGTAKKT